MDVTGAAGEAARARYRRGDRPRRQGGRSIAQGNARFMRRPVTMLDADIAELEERRRRGFLARGRGGEDQARRDRLAQLLMHRRRLDRAWEARRGS